MKEVKTLLKWGAEGGSLSICLIKVNGQEKLVKRFNFMTMDENDDEIWKGGEKEIESIESYWNEFTQNKHWYWRVPDIIDDCYKPLVTKSILEINYTTLAPHDLECIDRWEDLISGEVEPIIFDDDL